MVPKGLNSSHIYDFGSCQVTSGTVVIQPPPFSGEQDHVVVPQVPGTGLQSDKVKLWVTRVAQGCGFAAGKGERPYSKVLYT